MTSTVMLDYIIARETLLDILCALEPEELFIALLRMDGLPDTVIGRILNRRPKSIGKQMLRAQDRVLRTVPGAADLLAGRTRSARRRPPAEPAAA